MNEVTGPHFFEPCGEIFDQCLDRRLGQSSLGFDELGEITTCTILHDDEETPSCFQYFVQLDNVGVGDSFQN